MLDVDGACVNCGAVVAGTGHGARWRQRRDSRRSKLNAEARFRRAERDPAVRAIRAQFDDRPLSLEDAARWIEAQGQLPIGLPLSYFVPKTGRRTVHAGEELWLIARTADHLARANDWEPAAATAFILCGIRPPDPEPIFVDGAIAVGEDQAGWRRVRVSFDPDEDPELIAEKIRQWKDEAGVRGRSTADVERQIALHEHDVLQGRSRAEWEHSHPEWAYEHRQGYSAAVRRARQADPGAWPDDAMIERQTGEP